MSKPPPLLARGLIRPDRTLEQLRQNIPASSPRTPTPWERDYRLQIRKARTIYWIQTTLVLVFFGLWALPRGSVKLAILLVYGALTLRRGYRLMPWVDTEVDGFLAWWETQRDTRDRIRTRMTMLFLRILRILSFIAILLLPGIFLRAVELWRGECRERPRPTRIDDWIESWWRGNYLPAAPPETAPAETQPGTWDAKGAFVVSRDDTSPRALQRLGVPFLVGPSPYEVAVLKKLSGVDKSEVETRTQYVRRKGKGLASQDKKDEYDENGNDEDDEESILPLPSIPEPRRYIPPPGTLQTKLYRRFTSIDALRDKGLQFKLWDREYVVVSGALSFEQIRELYRLSQVIRRGREGLGPDPEDDSDGYDLGQTAGESDPPSEDSDGSSHDKDHIRSAHSRQQRGTVPLKRRSGQSPKRNWFVPRRGGDITEPIYLSTPSGNIETKPGRDSNQIPFGGSTSKSNSYFPKREPSTPSDPPHSTRAARNDYSPGPGPNKERPTKPPTFLPPCGGQTVPPAPARTRPRPTLTPPSTIPTQIPPPRPAIPVPGPTPPPTVPASTHPSRPTVPDTAPPPPAPMASPRASQPLLRNLASQVTTLRADCVHLWTTYLEIFEAGKPIHLQLYSQSLLQKIDALRNSFETIFNIQPRLSISSYQYKLEIIEAELDDILGLLQLFGETLDAKNPACPVLRKVRHSVSGILKGVALMLGRQYQGADENVSEARRKRLRTLVPLFVIEDRQTVRLAEEQRIRENEARDRAAKEQAEKQQAEKEMEEHDRLNKTNVMEIDTERASTVPIKAKPVKLPTGGEGLIGPLHYIDALRTRLSEGFLPTTTDAAQLLCGLRALIISLESMHKLQPGSVRPRDVHARMFINPELDPNFDIESFPEGQKGNPTDEYREFLHERMSQIGLDPSSVEEEWNHALSMHNLESTQLRYILMMLHNFGMVQKGEELTLGVVTAGKESTGSPATVQIHSNTHVIDHDNVVWLYNDNNTAATGGKGLGHWSGFAQNNSDRVWWQQVVEKWNIDLTERSAQETSARGNKGTAKNSNGNPKNGVPRPGWNNDQAGAGPSGTSFGEMQSLLVTYHEYIEKFDQYRNIGVISLGGINAMLHTLREEFLPLVQAVRAVGTKEERRYIIRNKRELEENCESLAHRIIKLWDSHSRHQPESDWNGDQQGSGSDMEDEPEHDNRSGHRFRGRSNDRTYCDDPELDTPPGSRREAASGSRGCGGGRGDEGSGANHRGGHRGRGENQSNRQRNRSEGRRGDRNAESHGRNGNGDSGRGGNSRGGSRGGRGGGRNHQGDDGRQSRRQGG